MHLGKVIYNKILILILLEVYQQELTDRSYAQQEFQTIIERSQNICLVTSLHASSTKEFSFCHTKYIVHEGIPECWQKTLCRNRINT